MTRIEFKKVKCPKCGEEFEVPVYLSIYTPFASNELIEKMNNNELDVYKCPKCKEKFSDK